MNVFAFIASLVRDLAWPIVVLVLFLILRKQIAFLIGQIAELELFGGKVKIGRDIERAAESTDAAVESITARRAGDSSIDDSAQAPADNPWLATLKSSPSMAAIEGWSGLEKELRKLGAAASIPRSSSTNVSSLLDDLQRHEIVNPQFREAARELRAIRNKVAHGVAPLSEAEGLSFINSAWELSRATHAIRKFRFDSSSEHD